MSIKDKLALTLCYLLFPIYSIALKCELMYSQDSMPAKFGWCLVFAWGMWMYGCTIGRIHNKCSLA